MSEELKKQMQDMERLIKINETLIQSTKKEQETERLKSIISSTKEDFLNANSKNIELEDKLQQRDNIIKEAREYIEQDIKANYFKRYDDEVYKLCDDLLEILDKVGSDKE